MSTVNTYMLVVAISPGQHKSADWPVFVIGVVVVVLIAAVTAWFKRR